MVWAMPIAENDHWPQALAILDDGGSRGVVVLGADDAPVLVTDGARALLARHFGACEGLPERLRAWLADPALPLQLASAEARLVVMLRRDRGRALLVEERPDPLSTAALARLGLTPREAEVMAQLAHGRTHEEIARALRMRPRTVAKHLEHVYRKLDVPNRGAAVARAFFFDRRMRLSPARRWPAAA